MKLFILGATGRTGKELIKQATERGYEIVAYVRSPQKLVPQDNLKVIQGNLNETSKMAIRSSNSISHSSLSMMICPFLSNIKDTQQIGRAHV